jgi:hypothetical protein
MTFLDDTNKLGDGETDIRELRSPGEVRLERLRRREDEHCILALDLVVNRLPVDGLWSSKQFEKMPRYRREYVRGYAAGASDMALRREGKPISKKLAPPTIRLPKRVARLQTGARWHRHANGNGWVSHTATVSLTAYVGPSCAVYDSARVVEYVELNGHSRVCGDAEMYGVSKAGGCTVVGGTARIGGAIHLLGDVRALDGVVMGEAVIRTQEQLARCTLHPGSVRRPGRHISLLPSLGVGA